jgi:DNA-binding transcriptional LysR family regulator
MIAISATGPEHIMDLGRLKYFAWIADLGSFFASELLSVAQSAFSVHGADLKVELKQRRINRAGR